MRTSQIRHLVNDERSSPDATQGLYFTDTTTEEGNPFGGFVNGKQLASKLTRAGFAIEEFGPHHFRVNNRLDLFPPEHRPDCSWHDIKTGKRGWQKIKDLLAFVEAHLAVPLPTPEPRKSVTLPALGWWHCLVCTQVFRDDSSHEFFDKVIEHLDAHIAKGE